MKLRVNYFNNTNYAETVNNINTDINQMTSIADSSVFFVITQAFSMTGGIIGLFIIDFRMTVDVYKRQACKRKKVCGTNDCRHPLVAVCKPVSYTHPKVQQV